MRLSETAATHGAEGNEPYKGMPERFQFGAIRRYAEAHILLGIGIFDDQFYTIVIDVKHST